MGFEACTKAGLEFAGTGGIKTSVMPVASFLVGILGAGALFV